MEPWQQIHIKDNLPGLIKNTDCNVLFMSILESENILSSEDIQQIQAVQAKHQRAKCLYDVIQTKYNSYKVLVQALSKTNQSGAYVILSCNKFTEVSEIGNLEFRAENLLGRISGTEDLQFFKGTFGDRNIAIRREVHTPLGSDTSTTKKEIAFLTKLDCQENILRYFACKIDIDLAHILLVFELCSFTLEEYLRDDNTRPNDLTKKSILKQLTSGLDFLHSNNILYLNVRPSSILISEDLPLKIRPKFSNFSSAAEVSTGGKCKVNSSKLMKNSEWLPRNILSSISQGQQDIDVDSAVDIFSLGCLFHFVLFSKHPFGEKFIRTANIINNQPLELASNNAFCERLIKKMIIHDDSFPIPLKHVLSIIADYKQSPLNGLTATIID